MDSHAGLAPRTARAQRSRPRTSSTAMPTIKERVGSYF